MDTDEWLFTLWTRYVNPVHPGVGFISFLEFLGIIPPSWEDRHKTVTGGFCFCYTVRGYKFNRLAIYSTTAVAAEARANQALTATAEVGIMASWSQVLKHVCLRFLFMKEATPERQRKEHCMSIKEKQNISSQSF